MRIAFGADEKTHLTDVLVEELHRRGHKVSVHGPPGDEDLQWADVAREVGELVAMGAAQQAVLCCWTGTGVSIMANKVPGVRAALCVDAETARGARLWNDANVLCLSLRSTSETMAREVLDAWFAVEAPDPTEAENIDRVRQQDIARGPL